MGPGDLETVLANIEKIDDPNLLVGFSTKDDAAVRTVTEDIAVVQTLDFFMPIVDDPYTFGMIAACNSISDIYAMGATPIMALSILGFPIQKLPASVANQIMLGGAEICRRANISIVGGHSIDDTEPKFGLSVTGLVHPKEVWYNSTGQVGDLLVLTKPLGIGAMGSANKKALLTPAQYAKFVETTTFLNDIPAKVGRKVGVHAATDVTGFGLLGHAWEMAQGAGVGLELWMEGLPVLDGAWELLQRGVKPGATQRNLQHLVQHIVQDELSEMDKYMLADPQTAGGLLFAVQPEKAEELCAELCQNGAMVAQVVGKLTQTKGIHLSQLSPTYF